MQARNQMKFRSILYIIIASLSLVFQYLFAIKWGGIGCAIAIASALFIGQGVIMNIYYWRKQNLNILAFWREILKMDIAPICVTIIYVLITFNYDITSWTSLFIHALTYSAIYALMFLKFSMNDNERVLLLEPFKRIIKNDKHYR